MTNVRVRPKSLSTVPARNLDTHPPSRRRPMARPLALIGLAGPPAYVVLVTALGLLWAGYDPVRDTQSLLGAVDSPYGLVMNVAGFMGVGISILAFAVAYHLVLWRSASAAIATGLLLVAGASMFVVGFFPCDAGCVDVTRIGRLHSTFSMPGAIALPVAAVVSSLAFRSDGRFGRAWRTSSFVLGLVTLAAGPMIGAELFDGINGLLQRAGMWPVLGWVSAVSAKLLLLHPRPVPPRRRISRLRRGEVGGGSR